MTPWKRILIAATIAMMPGVSPAHEFWLDAQIAGNGGKPALALEFRVGQMLKGVALPFVPQQVLRFDRLDGASGAIDGRPGETHVSIVPYEAETGFAGFAEMAPRTVHHKDWQAFLTYLDTEGLTGIHARHIARGLPKTGFSETYARHAKLIVTGTNAPDVLPGHSADAIFEITLHEISMCPGELLCISGSVFHRNRPVAGHQVTVLSEIGSGTETSRVMTDASGRFRVAVGRAGRVLLNAVLMSEAASPDAAWHSDWASVLLLRKTFDGQAAAPIVAPVQSGPGPRCNCGGQGVPGFLASDCGCAPARP